MSNTTSNSPPGEKISQAPSTQSDPEQLHGKILDEDESHEVFQRGGAVNFRGVGWVRCTLIFLKVLFATGVLSIPSAMVSLGAVGGAFSVIGWGGLNTYTAIIQGDFRNRHRGCHSIADMAHEAGGPVLREIVGGLFIIAYVLCSGSGILGVSIAFNTFSSHGTCTVWFALVSAILTAGAASVRKFEKLSFLTFAGFISIFVAVLMIVIAVTLRDRPAAAPQTGAFELGYYAIPPTVTFAAGMTATCTIFISSAGTSAFLPVISEMREPKDYRKAVFVAMGFVTSSYLCFALVVYAWCGEWVASPSLGSAGHTMQIAAYAVGFIGLIVSACLYLHVASKYVFVRILRHSKHLQANTFVHWGTWLGCIVGLCAVAFILAESIPIFNYLVAITGSVCFAPLAIMLPGYLWVYDHPHWRSGGAEKMIVYYLHVGMIALGAFICIGGTYGVAIEIKGAYDSGLIGGAFSCADNSASGH
ncbi:uncharacterized protein LTR77_001466 [Saxophila tyrrhenica]|uniref:Amino acid transporter transmembrane domain-containing protein n=1 Tax=Saxophila tyrrhenica TaxID=1690608 RepID=A0AAV9PNL7_9PEZI|nr:hypothetical protein LTR77_001466 [Saxophila tyrrhenica]